MHNCFRSFARDVRLEDLARAAQHCSLCPRLVGRTKILSSANGNLRSKVVFVAEAPGRLGADRTGVPLYGDQTGANFEALLGNVGWERQDVFVTNAVLCNPTEENGNNDTPTPEEVANCVRYLEMTIELVSPDVVVPLGAVALSALRLICPHAYTLRGHVGRAVPWAGRAMVPLYHPGPRALVHRAVAKQRADFMSLAQLVHPLKGLRRRISLAQSGRFTAPDVEYVARLDGVVCAILRSLGRVTYFKLTKLLYLTDLLSLERLGHTLTGGLYLRQREGPWPPNLAKALRILQDRRALLTFSDRMPTVGPGPDCHSTPVDPEAQAIVGETVERYGHLSNARIKTLVYLTAPMRYILQEERRGRDMRKVPVIYGDKTARELDVTRQE